jgi:DNA adenine methylase
MTAQSHLANTAPFPYFGGKREIAAVVWTRLGRPKQYIEPFCGSAAVLLAARVPASLEVVNDINGFIANFWRCVRHQPGEVAHAAYYPVSHIDLGARHGWLMAQRDRLGTELQDPNWHGDAKVAGWWLWGQCSWIGSGWCEWTGKIPHVGNAGRGVQATGQIPHVSDAGRGELLTSGGETAWRWLHALARRLERVRVTHGVWDRCLNSHYGGGETAVFFDPPYKHYESLYGDGVPAAEAVEAWCRENGAMRIALCGHVDDYDLPGWHVERWTRRRLTYAGSDTTDKEAIWFSPSCLPRTGQRSLFEAGDTQP